jgi:hypothetical protein
VRFVLMDIPHDVDPARASQCRPVVDIHGRRPGAVGIHGEDSLESFIDQIPRDAGRLSAAEGSRFGKVAWPTAVNGPTGGVTIVPLDVNPYLPAASATVHSRACANCAVPMTVAQSISLRCRAAGFMTIPPLRSVSARTLARKFALQRSKSADRTVSGTVGRCSVAEVPRPPSRSRGLV